jgi:hypothetical protein
MFKTLVNVALGVLLAVVAPLAWRFLAEHNNTQVHQVNP